MIAHTGSTTSDYSAQSAIAHARFARQWIAAADLEIRREWIKKQPPLDAYHDFMCTRQYYENLPRQHTRAVITTAGNLRSQTNNHCKTHIHTHAHNPGLLQTPRRHTTTPPHTVSRIQAIHPYFQPRTHGTLHGTTTTVGEPDTTVQPAPHNRGRRDRYAPREFAAL